MHPHVVQFKEVSSSATFWQKLFVSRHIVDDHERGVEWEDLPVLDPHSSCVLPGRWRAYHVARVDCKPERDERGGGGGGDSL